MPLTELLDGVRARPDERVRRTVLADALLATGDPRGELMVAQLDDRAPEPESFERCVERVRAAVPGLERLRFEHGLVSELELPFEQLPHIDLDWLRSEPLVRVRVSVPDDPVALARGFADAHEVLAACRGLSLDSSLDAQQWRVLVDPLTELAPRSLELSLTPELLETRPPPWPSVEVMSLEAQRVVSEQLLGCLPNLRKLEIRSGLGIWAALQRKELQHLDIRSFGESLQPGELLAAWAAAYDCSVRSPMSGPHFSLAGPELDDVFGCSGLSWSASPDPEARVVALPGEPPRFAMARGKHLQLYRRGELAWERELDAPIGALGARRGELIVGRRDGRVERHRLSSDEVEALVTLPGPVRSISTRERDLAIVHAGGWWAQIEGQVLRGEDEPLALILTPSGIAYARGSQLVRGAWTVELGEPITALVFDRQIDTLLLVAGRYTWKLSHDKLQIIGERPRGAPSLIASHAGAHASCHGPRSVFCTRTHEYTTFEHPLADASSIELEGTVADLCVMPDGETVVVALEEGGFSLLSHGDMRVLMSSRSG